MSTEILKGKTRILQNLGDAFSLLFILTEKLLKNEENFKIVDIELKGKKVYIDGEKIYSINKEPYSYIAKSCSEDSSYEGSFSIYIKENEVLDLLIGKLKLITEYNLKLNNKDYTLVSLDIEYYRNTSTRIVYEYSKKEYNKKITVGEFFEVPLLEARKENQDYQYPLFKINDKLKYKKTKDRKTTNKLKIFEIEVTKTNGVFYNCEISPNDTKYISQLELLQYNKPTVNDSKNFSLFKLFRETDIPYFNQYNKHDFNDIINKNNYNNSYNKKRYDTDLFYIVELKDRYYQNMYNINISGKTSDISITGLSLEEYLENIKKSYYIVTSKEYLEHHLKRFKLNIKSYRNKLSELKNLKNEYEILEEVIKEKELKEFSKKYNLLIKEYENSMKRIKLVRDSLIKEIKNLNIIKNKIKKTYKLIFNNYKEYEVENFISMEKTKKHIDNINYKATILRYLEEILDFKNVNVKNELSKNGTLKLNVGYDKLVIDGIGNYNKSLFFENMCININVNYKRHWTTIGSSHSEDVKLDTVKIKLTKNIKKDLYKIIEEMTEVDNINYKNIDVLYKNNFEVMKNK